MFPWYVYLAAIFVPMGIVAVINKIRLGHEYPRTSWYIAAVVANISMVCLGLWAVLNAALDSDNPIIITGILIGCVLCWLPLMIWSGGINEDGQD